MKIKIVFVIGTLLIASLAIADTLEFTNGKSLEGTFISRSKGMVQFEVNGIVGNYDEKDIKNIAFGGETAEKTGVSEPAPASKEAAAHEQPAAVAAKPVTVASGTVVHVRTSESVNTKQHKAGHKFTAKLEADLISGDGTVAAPRGSTVYGEISSSRQAGRVAGKSEMTIVFTGIMVENQIKPIQSGEIQAVAESGSGRETVGRAARFAAIGALADGSDGAKTGAKIGAGVSLLTKGENIDIPAGTLLDFPLAAAFDAR